MALALGLSSPALAQTIPDGYLEISNWSESFAANPVSNSNFIAPEGWNHYVEGTGITYTNTAHSGQSIGTARTQEEGNYDLLVTPQVKGTMTFSIKRYVYAESYVLNVEFYKLTKNSDGTFSFDKNSPLPYAIPEDLQKGSTSTDWVENQSINVGDEYTFIGIRLSNGYIDDFSAPNALIPVKKILKLSNANYSDGYSYSINSNPDGTFTVGVKVDVTNNGNVDLNSSEEGENYKISLVRVISTNNPYSYEILKTIDLPDLKVGETKTITITDTFDIPNIAVDSNGVIRFRLDFVETFTSETPNSAAVSSWAEVKPYNGIIEVRYDKKSTSNGNITDTQVTDNTKIHYGTFRESRSMDFRVRNRGAAPLQITSVEAPDWVSFEGITFPTTIEAGGITPFKLTVGGEPGLKEGSVKFITDGLVMSDLINIAAEVVSQNEFFANFEDDGAFDQWYAPIGSTNWKVNKYESTERNYTENYYPAEYGFNDYRLENTGQTNPVQELYSPKLAFNAGDEISFYAAKKTNNGSDVKLVVKYSPDRANWTELGTITVTNDNPDLQFSSGTSSTTTSAGQNILKRFSFEMPQGEYYISLGAGYVLVDDFHGGTLVDVEYDIVPEGISAGKTKTVNNPLEVSATFKNINSTDVTAEEQTVTLYANGKAVATATPVAIASGKAATYNFSYIPHNAGETTLYAEIAIGEYTVKSANLDLKIQDESAELVNQIGECKTTDNTIPFSLGYNNSKSEFIYTTKMLKDLEGTKILKVSYPYYKTDIPHTAETVTIWMENTSDTEVGSSFTATDNMTKVAEISNYVFEKAGTSVSDYAEMEFVLDTPFEYDNSKNLRIIVESLSGTWKSTNFIVDNTVTCKAIYYRNDTRSTYIANRDGNGTVVNNKMPVINLFTELAINPVTGTVKDTKGNAIEGATVTATAKDADLIYTAISDDKGSWSMPIYQNDHDYTISASADGYKASEPVDLDMVNGHNFELAVQPHLSFDAIDMSVLKGSDVAVTKDVAINLNVENEVSYQGFQFNVTVPTGVEITTVETPLSENPTCMQVDAATNTYKVLAYGSAGSANTEAIATLTLSTKYDAAADYPIKDNIVISDVIFSTPTGQDIEDITGYTGLLTINLEEVKATEIVVENIEVMDPSYSSADDVTTVTAGENISGSVSLLPKETTDSVEDIEWTVTGAEGITVTVDEKGNMEINTENAEFDGKEANVTITGTVGNATYTKTITVKAVLLGDANDNGAVTVADVVTTAKVAVTETWAEANVTNFCFPNANVNTNLIDGKQGINSQDVTGIVNIILKRDDESGARSVKRQASVFETNDRLVADNFRTAPGQETVINVRLDNSYNYAALQAAVIIPDGMKVINVTKGGRAANHDLVYHIGSSKVGVMIFSLSNASFIESDDALFQLHVVAEENCDNLQFENINASDAASNGYILGYDGGMNETGTTVIDGINADDDARYFDLNGIEFKASMLQPGIYIRVKSDKAEKVVIR